MDQTGCEDVPCTSNTGYLMWAIIASAGLAGGVVIGIYIYSQRSRRRDDDGFSSVLQKSDDEHYKRLYETEKREKEKALERLSKIMSNKLTDGNPNIANLSDEKRPTKLAEEYSELYDNAWSDAFENISVNNNTKKIEFLREILKVCFDWCRERSENQSEQLNKLILCPGVPSKSFAAGRTINRDFLKNFKDERKLLAKETAEHLVDEICDKVRSHFSNTGWSAEVQQASVKTYSKQCAMLCWLMVVQDPPMDIGFSITDVHQYKAYTRSGQQVDFVVWPPLYLQKGGNLMSKGIAQMK